MFEAALFVIVPNMKVTQMSLYNRVGKLIIIYSSNVKQQ